MENYYNNGKGKDEKNKTRDESKPMSRPRVFLEKVKRMKASKSSSDFAGTEMSPSPAGPTYTYNPLAMKITARNVLNEQLRIMLCFVLRIM